MHEIAVLLYHDLCEKDGDIFQKINPMYTTSRRRFTAHLDWLASNGYVSVTLSDLLAAKNGLIELPEKLCVITFDGSFSGWRIANEELLSRDMKAVYYVVAGWVHGAHPYPGKSGAGWKLLKEIQDSDLAEIGSHSVNHRPFTLLPDEGDEAFRKRIFFEMQRSKEILDENLCQDTIHFASPWGQGAEGLLKEFAEEIGYRTIRGTKQRLEHLETMDPMDIGITYGDNATIRMANFHRLMQLCRQGPIVSFLNRLLYNSELNLRHIFKLNKKFQRKVEFEHKL